MATINLGAIKFNWKGAYSGATAYVVDDVVESSGSSYICIAATTGNAPPNASYWEQMSSAGTNGTDGTDLTTTLSTQGDLVYRDASGLARLGAGTSGQALITQGTGANPSWGDVGGGILAVSHKMYGGTNEINTQNRTADYTFTSNSYEISELTLSITPQSNTSKFLIQLNLQAGHSDAYVGIGWLTYQVSGGTEYAITSSGTRGVTFRYDGANFSSSNASNPSIAHQVMVAPATTSAVTFRVRIASADSGTPWYINRNPNGSTDVDDGGYMLSTMTVFELDGSKSTKATTSTNETKT